MKNLNNRISKIEEKLSISNFTYSDEMLKKLMKLLTENELNDIKNARTTKEQKLLISLFVKKYEHELIQVRLSKRDVKEIKLLNSYSNEELKQMVAGTNLGETLWDDFFNKIEMAIQ